MGMDMPLKRALQSRQNVGLIHQRRNMRVMSTYSMCARMLRSPRNRNMERRTRLGLLDLYEVRLWRT
jgi:hypothetical protein